MTTMMQDARKLEKVAARLRRELDDYETAGLEERAAKVRSELATVETRIQNAKNAHQGEQLERIRREREARERHEARERLERAAPSWRREMACRATTQKGQPCEAPELPGRGWCYHGCQ